ncbi:MAG: YceI family protein [Chitinophagales bacterium]
MQTTTDLAQKVQWALDPTHSSVGFRVKHMMMTTVKGTFDTFTVNVETEDEDFVHGKISFTADINSVNTKNEGRDQHLRGADFFDAEKYPEMKFVATRMEDVDHDGSYIMYGDLTIRDITKEVKLDVEYGGVLTDPWGNQRAGFTLHGKINRKDWNLNWNVALEAGGLLVGEEVKIEAEIELIKQQVEA